MKQLNLFRLQLKYLSFTKDPTNTEKIFEMIELAQKLPSDIDQIEYFEEKFLADPLLKKCWKKKYLPDIEVRNPENYKEYPQGTLGANYYKHMTKYNLDYKLFPKVEIKRPMDYINQRVYWVHDIWHALLGYGADPRGEIELQAFTMAQMQSPFNVLLICGGLINLVKTDPRSVSETFGKMVDAYQRGKTLPKLIGVRLEKKMDLSIDDIFNSLKYES